MIINRNIPHIGEFTKIPINLFFAIGFCVIRWKPNEKPKKLQIFFITCLLVHIMQIFLGMLMYSIYESMETSLEKTAYIIYTTFAANSFIKLCCCVFNLKKLHKVLRYLEKYYPKTTKERIDYKLDEHLKRIYKYNYSLTIIHFSVTGMFNIFPLIQSIIWFCQSGRQEFQYLLPFPMIFIFNTQNSLGYTIAYITQISASYSASFAYLASDLLLISCVHLINMNFKYLAKCIREFKPKGDISDTKMLRKFMVYHNNIFRSVKLVDDTFNISILLNYVGSVTLICLIGIQLVAGTDYLHLVKFLSFLISALIHVYFISKFGTELISLSCEIGNAFMYHPWYDGHIEYQRALVMTIARAQKPAHLNAFKFFIISMETFKSLVSISYQFFTLIKTRYMDQ